MIDFSLSDEHRLLEQSIREWGAQNVAPFIRENDRQHHFDRDRILGGMAKLGLLGVSVPQEYGGAGMDYIALGIASEELEYLDTSLRVIMSVHAGLNCLTLLSWGTEDQKQRYLVPQAQGKKISGYGLTEPGAGSDARAIQTTATKKGDRYVLNGEKSWISLADVATGLIRACRDASVKYAKERKTFGVEIGQHQLVKEMIAQMESDYQSARLLWLRSGWLKNNGMRNTRETGLAKWFATVASERAAGDAVQIHGANGYSDEYPVGRFYRNCKGAVIYEGTREIHKLMQADYVLGYRTDRPTRCELPPYVAR